MDQNTRVRSFLERDIAADLIRRLEEASETFMDVHLQYEIHETDKPDWEAGQRFCDDIVVFLRKKVEEFEKEQIKNRN